MGAIRAGTALGSGASTAYQMAQATSGESGAAGVGAGLAGVARAGAGAVRNAARSAGQRFASTVSDSAQAGRNAAFRATGGTRTGGRPANENSAPAGGATGGAPAWARRLRSEQRMRAHAHATTQAIRDGDRPGASANPDLEQREH
jgi:type IV secretion system protein TrbL